MRSDQFRARVLDLVKAGLAVSLLLVASGESLAQTVNLTAQAATAAMPDGQVVPMWGYKCGTATGATCVASNANAGTGWSPVIIRVPYVGAATTLTINLTNSLPVPKNATSGVPTSLVIAGQLGGGLGKTATTTASPAHPVQTATWPIAGGSAQFTPPQQAARVQSFSTEVATGGMATLTWSNLKPGTYLIESGTHPSIQGPMGLYGMLIVTTPASAGNPALAYTNVPYDADLPLLLSEIDPVQNAAVAAAVATPNFSETAVWSGQAGSCGDPKSPTFGTCYPPAVNYDPRYYMINGVAFDRTNQNRSSFPVSTTPSTGRILVRYVNAGLRAHVPVIVGAQTGNAGSSGVALIAEDGNVLPGTPKVQSATFLAAGKAYDVMMNAPASGALALPVFDRQLSLSTNNQRDGGMQAYIAVNGGALPQASSSTNAVANPDTYFLVPGNPVIVADPAKGVIANDVGVYGVTVQQGPSGGTLTLNPDGTFTYSPASGTTTDSFIYQANGNPAIKAKVTLAACTSN